MAATAPAPRTPSAGQVNAATGASKNAPQVKLVVTHTAPTVHAAARGAAAAVARTGQPAKPPPAPAAFNPLQNFLTGQYLSTPQIAQMAQNITAGATKASLVPLRQQAQQIQGTQNTVAGRLAGYTQQGDQIMQGLQANAQQGALTSENMAAQAASNTATAIDRSGAAAQALNGGYLDPQVAAALQNQRTQFGTNAGAEAGFANSQGQNENNFMANLRGTAALQAQSMQGNVASIYGKQLATNQGQQDALIAREGPTAKALANSIGQQQFSDFVSGQAYKLNAKKVQIAGVTADSLAASRKAAADTAQYRAQTDRYRADTYAQVSAGTLALGHAKLSQAGVIAVANLGIKKAQLALNTKNIDSQVRDRLVKETQAWQTIKTKGTTGNATQDTAVRNIEGYRAWYLRMSGQPPTIPKGFTGTPAQAKAAQLAQLRNIIATKLEGQGAEAQAALHMAIYGYLDAQDVAGLQAQGVTILPEWIANRPPASGGPIKPTPPRGGNSPVLPGAGVGR